MNEKKLDLLIEQKKRQMSETSGFASRAEFGRRFLEQTVHVRGSGRRMNWVVFRKIAAAAVIAIGIAAAVGVLLFGRGPAGPDREAGLPEYHRAMLVSDPAKEKAKKEFSMPENQAVQLFAEASRLLGRGTGVVLLDRELITYTRQNGGAGSRFQVRFKNPDGGKIVSIIFAGSDNETIRLNSELLSGTIIVTASGKDTLLVDFDLLSGDGTRSIRKVAVLNKNAGNAYRIDGVI